MPDTDAPAADEIVPSPLSRDLRHYLCALEASHGAVEGLVTAFGSQAELLQMHHGDLTRTAALVAQLERRTAHLDQQLAAARLRIAQQDAAIAAHQQDGTDLRNDIRLLQVERDNLNTAHAAATADADHHKAIAADAERTTARLTAEANQAKARITELEGLYTKTEGDRAKTEDERKTAVLANATLRKERDAIAVERDALKAKLTRARPKPVPAPAATAGKRRKAA